MSRDQDDFNRLLTDLKSYLQQHQQAGWEWYLDAGPAAPDTPVAATATGGRKSPPDKRVQSEAAVDKPQTPVRPPAGDSKRQGPARRAIARASSTASGPRGKDDFDTMCQTFVEETLARIESSRREMAAQGDIFAAPQKKPRRLSRKQKTAVLAEMASEVAPCTQCKLHAGRTQTVFGVGDADADLVFIGEAPGRDEDLQGEPFVGRAGKLLTDILKAIDLKREEVYICNILKCRPPQNRDPEREEVDACEPYLKQQLEVIKPKVICCLGRVAAQNLLGTRAALGVLREAVHFYEGIPVMVTFHPAALLRNPHWKRPTWEDVRKLRALYDALRK